jgi:4-diphosphocytidyl-2-C-methyl-D-erythritol kinase
MNLKASAKINIGLKIINKRSDGFHNIETIFYPVKLADEISFEIFPSHKNNNSVFLNSDNKIIPNDRNNICYKVIENFFKVFRITDFYNVKIYLHKVIPVGGGLGGGSSDAASILKYLINYFRIDVIKQKTEILNIALTVGSDVPFFLIHKPCFAFGRGEHLKILKDFNLDAYDILLVNPNLHVSTKSAFESLNYQTDEIHASNLSEVSAFDELSLSVLENDFEKVVFDKYKELIAIKDELKEFGSVYSSLSGSGATMYGLFKKDGTVETAYQYYKSKNYFVYM